MKKENMTQNSTPKDYWKMLGSLAGFIMDLLTSILNYDQIKYWFNHKKELKKRFLEVFSVVDEYSEIRERWQKIYKNHFNWDVDFSTTIVPEKPSEGKWRLLFIAKGMTCNIVFKIWSKSFKCWRVAEDLDKTVSKNSRIPNENYAVWVRDDQEPDKEFLGESTQEADSNMEIGETLLERMLHELVYFIETKKHLDIKGVTFCSGSRYSDGGVPRVYWLPGSRKVRVGWCSVSCSFSDCGVRRAVSLTVSLKS